MVYIPTGSVGFRTASALQYSDWYTVQSVSELLNSLKNTDLTSPASKADSLTNVRLLPIVNPYIISDGTSSRSIPKRFGQIFTGVTPLYSTLFVCRELGSWHEILEAFVTALSTAPTLPSDQDPSFELFTNALDLAAHALTSLSGIYNFNQFELAFSLTWV